MRKGLRYILFPFSLIYGGIVWTRNQLFDKKIFRSAIFDFPLICVGNLSVGGTGKTPMVELIVRMLHPEYKVATLSRGYKRRTKGFVIANEQTNAADIGDEPMQIHQNFPEVTVAVAEERVIGIPQLIYEKPSTEVIILDDAFQHREVKPGLNILLTDYHHLYTKDLLLPAGTLRDIKSSSKRANIVIVTKCISNLTQGEKEAIITELNPGIGQKIYFTKIEYGNPYHLFGKQIYSLEADCQVLLVCGIANPKPIEKILASTVSAFRMLKFNDHHQFTIADIREIKNQFLKLEKRKKIILTTEKDAVRLSKFHPELKDLPVYVLPMKNQFLFGEAPEFEKDITGFIDSFKHQVSEKQ